MESRVRLPGDIISRLRLHQIVTQVHKLMYVSFIGSRLTNTRLTLINRTRLRPLPFNHSGNRKISSWNKLSEFQLPFNHLYQTCSGPGLDQVPVDTSQLSGSRKICISFGNLEDENGKTESWRNTYRGADLEKMRFVPGTFSCTNSPTSCTWRKISPATGVSFETKNRAIFLERFFWRDFSGAALLPIQLCSH